MEAKTPLDDHPPFIGADIRQLSSTETPQSPFHICFSLEVENNRVLKKFASPSLVVPCIAGHHKEDSFFGLSKKKKKKSKEES